MLSFWSLCATQKQKQDALIVQLCPDWLGWGKAGQLIALLPSYIVSTRYLHPPGYKISNSDDCHGNYQQLEILIRVVIMECNPLLMI